MATASINDVLQGKSYRNNSYRNSSSIETSEVHQKYTKDDLPEWILPFVQNIPWAVRLANLLNEGYESQLRQLVEYAEKNARVNIVHYFARACSKKEWTNTLEFMSKLAEMAKNAREVAGRIKAKPEHLKAIYKACWRLKASVIRHAVTAEEVGNDKFKFFCWLTRPQERQNISISSLSSPI